MYAVEKSTFFGYSGESETIDLDFYDSPEEAEADFHILVAGRSKKSVTPSLSVESGLPSAYFDYGGRGTVTLRVAPAPIE